MGAEGWLRMDVGTQGVSTGEGKGKGEQGRGVVLRKRGSTGGVQVLVQRGGGVKLVKERGNAGTSGWDDWIGFCEVK